MNENTETLESIQKMVGSIKKFIELTEKDLNSNDHLIMGRSHLIFTTLYRFLCDENGFPIWYKETVDKIWEEMKSKEKNNLNLQ